MQKIHRRSAGDEARIGLFQITDNQFPGANTAFLNHAVNGREDSFGEDAKSRTRGAYATLVVSVARLAWRLRPVLAAQRPRVRHREARSPPELRADQAQ